MWQSIKHKFSKTGSAASPCMTNVSIKENATCLYVFFIWGLSKYPDNFILQMHSISTLGTRIISMVRVVLAAYAQ